VTMAGAFIGPALQLLAVAVPATQLTSRMAKKNGGPTSKLRSNPCQLEPPLKIALNGCPPTGYFIVEKYARLLDHNLLLDECSLSLIIATGEISLSLPQTQLLGIYNYVQLL
jgi:hypothetical protein